MDLVSVYPTADDYEEKNVANAVTALEIILPSVERFADNVACQHYIITYGDNRAKIRNLCAILGIEVFEM